MPNLDTNSSYKNQTSSSQHEQNAASKNMQVEKPEPENSSYGCTAIKSQQSQIAATKEYFDRKISPEIIRNHYSNPQIKAIIIQHSEYNPNAAEPENASYGCTAIKSQQSQIAAKSNMLFEKIKPEKSSSWRCGNKDFVGWWKRASPETEKLYVLSEDYDLVTRNVRSLYWSLNFFEDSIRTREQAVPKKGERHGIIGDYGTTVAYSLSVDIDHADGSDVFHTKEALEAAAQFFIGKLHDNGITRSYDVLFSGGGMYILTHPAITVCPTPNAERTDRERWFYLLAETYNMFINDVQQQFFESCPEYADLVKFDALNNSKRVFKSLFSIHKKHPFAVIPLDKNVPVIDFDAAHPPLSDSVINTGVSWLSDSDMNERQALIEMLFQYGGQVREKRSADYIDTEITMSDKPVICGDFPPCINAVLNAYKLPSGATRMISFLSAYLYQVRWDRQHSFALVLKTADQLGMGRDRARRYFNDWFGKMNCPSCSTIRTTGTHYPAMNMGELNICKPDDECEKIHNPIRYKQMDKTMEVEI